MGRGPLLPGEASLSRSYSSADVPLFSGDTRQLQPHLDFLGGAFERTLFRSFSVTGMVSVRTLFFSAKLVAEAVTDGELVDGGVLDTGDVI
jgi:hypothetical protein